MTSDHQRGAVSAEYTIRNIKAQIRTSYPTLPQVDPTISPDVYHRIAAEVHAICASL